ncbi:outer membrane biogenesis protein BamB [Rubripirellula obstinata]|uniref:Outer membrane biogenesis protein BamB n=1 Tax=Rubripirellula obstinata TaxID=406547 RepID=A0A5B1CFZ9_9BACT|nr:PQQ-binding-like beta-propeller repeat protein [Rubripirellula obstinata]KAA1259466.1 outer membrane biogenesis protein BamB [Rubripirellula obstinata]
MPQQFPDQPNVLWEQSLTHAGLGGIAATSKYVVFGDRDDDDFHDVFRCLDADSGEPIWEVQRLAIDSLDYGNSPRATPLIVGQYVYCRGAHGHLLCLRLADGQVVWERNFRDEFPVPDELPWGYCGSPLMVDQKLIVATGNPDASLLALNPINGEVIWKSPGRPLGYGSLIAGNFRGVKQVVGHDQTTLGGWDLKTGQRLWTIEPKVDGDFNVPTPLVIPGADGSNQLMVATENNGIRLYRFDSSGIAIDPPAIDSQKLRTDMTTPIVVGSNVFCVKTFLYCLDAASLKEKWRLRDKAIGDYASLLASPDRLLVIGKGELLLFASDGEKELISRMRVFPENQTLYSFPAMVGRRLYVRGSHAVKCLQF